MVNSHNVYLDDKFENINLIFNFHIYLNHKDKKKEYFRKLKRREIACRTEKSKSTASKTPRAPIPQPSQARPTSEKNKRFRRKKEFLRTGALVPDIIRISNYISCNRMSSKTFKSSCKKLTKDCKDQEICVAHSSWPKLKNISSNLTKILAQSDEPTFNFHTLTF